MKSKVKDKLVGIYAPQEFSKWFWDNHEDMEFISTNKLKEQLPDERLLKEYALYKGDELLAMGTSEEHSMKYKVITYFDNMEDEVEVFDNKINRLHHLRGVKYRNARLYKVEMEVVESRRIRCRA